MGLSSEETPESPPAASASVETLAIAIVVSIVPLHAHWLLHRLQGGGLSRGARRLGRFLHGEDLFSAEEPEPPVVRRAPLLQPGARHHAQADELRGQRQGQAQHGLRGDQARHQVQQGLLVVVACPLDPPAHTWGGGEINGTSFLQQPWQQRPLTFWEDAVGVLTPPQRERCRTCCLVAPVDFLGCSLAPGVWG